MPQPFDDSNNNEPSPDAARHARWLLKKAGLKTGGVEPPEPLGLQNLDADYRAVVDANRGKIKEARLDMLQHDLEQLQTENIRLSAKIAQLEFVTGQHNQLLEWLRAKVTKLLWFVPTEEIDPMVEANGSDRYPRNWTKRTGGKLFRVFGRKAGE